MRSLLVIILLVVSTLSLTAQDKLEHGGSLISTENIVLAPSVTASDLAGVYDFGESEGEWTLKLVVNRQDTLAIISSGEWTDDGGWKQLVDTISNVTINGMFLRIDSMNAVAVKHRTKPYIGLIIENSLIWDTHELAWKREE